MRVQWPLYHRQDGRQQISNVRRSFPHFPGTTRGMFTFTSHARVRATWNATLPPPVPVFRLNWLRTGSWSSNRSINGWRVSSAARLFRCQINAFDRHERTRRTSTKIFRVISITCERKKGACQTVEDSKKHQCEIQSGKREKFHGSSCEKFELLHLRVIFPPPISLELN